MELAAVPDVNMPDEWLTLREACDYLRVAPSTLRDWTNKGRILSSRTAGGHRRFRRSDLDAFLQRPALGEQPAPSAEAANGLESILTMLQTEVDPAHHEQVELLAEDLELAAQSLLGVAHRLRRVVRNARQQR